MTTTERELRALLLNAEVRAALADLPSITRDARRDLASRLIDLGIELRPDGSLRMAAGGDLDDGVALARADGGEHLFVGDPQAAVASAAPDLSGLTPTQKLAFVNGGDL